MSRFRGPPGDTDRRPYFRPMPPDDRDRPFRPPPGERPPWADRPDWPQRPPPDWPPPRPAPSDWEDRPPPSSHWSPDGALNVLNSCGLDARDLSLLAELPEDMLTLKSLPQLLSQMKQKKDPYAPPGYGPVPHTDQSRDPYPGPAPRALDHAPGLYREPGPSQSAFPAASAGFVVDYEHRASDLDYRKSPERLRRSSPGFSAHGSKDWAPRKPPTVPSETQARDFHGKKPTLFPYSCSLCDITVLSENVWMQHINTTFHADRQLSLLQRFPTWDCRVDTARRDGKHPKQEKKNKKDGKDKVPTKAKVVCVKFSARSVDEAYLRNLLKDFGQIVNIALFPSLGFIELESPEQAQNLISFFTETPHKVDEQEVEFSISTTFNFLQSSFVLNFFPVPFGNEGKADLMAIIKRFGTPLYTMFITDTMHAYVEMQSAADAHKMVEYYSTTPLKMNGVNIIVSFSQEFRTLARCARARPYEETEDIKPETDAQKPNGTKKKVVKKGPKSQAGTEGQTPEKAAEADAEGQRKDTDAEAKQSEEAQGQSDEGSDMDIDGEEVVGAKLEDEEEEEEDSQMPFNLESCITLDEVSDTDDPAKVEEEEEGEEDEDSPRVVYIGNLPLCRFSDPQFIKMVQLVHRPVRYFINRQQRTGLAEFATRRQAREFVAKMQDHSFGGCSLQTFISNKYNRLPWGRGVEYDEFGRIMRHFRVGKSPERRKTPPPPRHPRPRRSKDKDSPRSRKHHDKSRERSRSRRRSRGRSRGKSMDRSRGKSRDRSRGKSRDRSRGKSRDRSRGKSRDRSRGKSRDRSRGKSKGRSRSRDRSKGKTRARSRGRSRDRSRGRSRDRSGSRRDKSGSPTAHDKDPPPGDTEASTEASSEQDKSSDIRIENVVSLKTTESDEKKLEQAAQTSDREGAETGKQEGASEAGDKMEVEDSVKSREADDKDNNEQESQEEGWTVANLNTDESLLTDDTEKTDGGKTTERKDDREVETEKRGKDDSGDGEQDSTKTEGGATEAKVPTKAVGTDYIRFYCALCHVMYSDQQEVRAHCSTLNHYNKYKEMTGKDPWSASD